MAIIFLRKLLRQLFFVLKKFERRWFLAGTEFRRPYRKIMQTFYTKKQTLALAISQHRAVPGFFFKQFNTEIGCMNY
jgi:hypothetical protein